MEGRLRRFRMHYYIHEYNHSFQAYSVEKDRAVTKQLGLEHHMMERHMIQAHIVFSRDRRTEDYRIWVMYHVYYGEGKSTGSLAPSCTINLLDMLDLMLNKPSV